MDDLGEPADPATAPRSALAPDVAGGHAAARPHDAAGGQAAARPHDAEFSAFYREFIPTLVAFLIWQGAPLHDAADVAQHTMAKAYQGWETIDHPAAWARTVASREYARRVANVEEDPVGDVPDASPLLRPGDDPAAFEQQRDVLRLLALLPSRQRQVMAWTVDGYTPAEIAEILRTTPDAVRSSLYKARATLKIVLRGEADTR